MIQIEDHFHQKIYLSFHNQFVVVIILHVVHLLSLLVILLYHHHLYVVY